MTPSDRPCPNCGAPSGDSDVACAGCGQLLPRRVAAISSRLPIVVGVLLAIPTAIGVWFGYALFFIALVSLAGVHGTGPKQFLFVANIVLTIGLCALALRVGIGFARRGDPGLAALVLLAAFFGLVPASLCTFGIVGS